MRYGPLPSPSPTWPVAAELREEFVLEWPERYAWPPAGTWVEPLLDGLSRLVRIERREREQAYRGIVLIGVQRGSRGHEVALDYGDRHEINEEAAKRCAAYFKMQHLEGGYGRSNVVPGGYVPGSSAIYRYLRPLRALADRREYRYDVYGRFGLSFASDLRRRAVRLLSDERAFAYHGSLRPVMYSQYLREIAKSRVCIDLPGNGDLCHRLVDYLAIGACVVGPRPRTTLHVPLRDGQHVVHVREDLADLVERCAEYVEDADAREARRAAAREFFDRYLHTDQLSGYYLHRMTELIR